MGVLTALFTWSTRQVKRKPVFISFEGWSKHILNIYLQCKKIKWGDFGLFQAMEKFSSGTDWNSFNLSSTKAITDRNTYTEWIFLGERTKKGTFTFKWIHKLAAKSNYLPSTIAESVYYTVSTETISSSATITVSFTWSGTTLNGSTLRTLSQSLV